MQGEGDVAGNRGVGWRGVACGAAAAVATLFHLWISGHAAAQVPDAGWAPATSAAANAPLPGFDKAVTHGAATKGASAHKRSNGGVAAKDTGKSGRVVTKSAATRSGATTAAPAVAVQRAKLEGDGVRTRFVLSLSKGVRSEIFTLSSPYRVVIDIPDTGFALPDGTGRTGAGLVSSFRYGLFAERKARIVLDATAPVRIDAARMTAGQGQAVDLIVEIVPTTAEVFGAGTGVGIASGSAAETRPQVYDEGAPKKPSAKPVVLIDPGHGGIDPGAIGVTNLLEKTVVLEVAQRLKRRLEATGRYDVRMTRSGDVFVSLDQRVKLSQEIGADLFISLHADSIASKAFAPVVRGATVYTLSEHASDEQARAMAEKENASDMLAGLEVGGAQEEGIVRNILIDLMKRETANYSAEFSGILTSSMRTTVSLAREPQRSAAFKVLRQTHAPSVLIELGYMSNEADESLMRQPAWQAKLAQSIAGAVASFFERRTARGP